MPIAKAELNAVIALLCNRWPQTFVMHEAKRKPLNIGIHLDIAATGFHHERLTAALRFYVGNPGYLAAMQAGAARIDLAGAPAAVVTEEQAALAKAVLAAITAKRQRKQQQAAKPAAQQQPKPAQQPQQVANPAPQQQPKPAQQPQQVANPAPQQQPKPKEKPKPQRDGLAALKAAAQRRQAAA